MGDEISIFEFEMNYSRNEESFLTIRTWEIDFLGIKIVLELKKFKKIESN